MPSRRCIDWYAVHALLRERERVVTHADLVAAGMAPSTISHRIRPGGPWQRLLPGVVLTHTGTPTRRERLLGATRFVGEGGVVTGLTALSAYGVRAVPHTTVVSVLQPATRQRTSTSYLQVSRSRRMPKPEMRAGIPYAPVARALIDACRNLDRLDQVRELVAEVVQRGLCSVADVATEVRAAARQRTALSRAVLAEVSAGIRSVAEAKAREIYHRAGVPQPLWNADLVTLDGEFIACTDGYWEALAAALEIDSMRWHLTPSGYQRTQRRQGDLTVRGVLVLPVAPAFVLDDTEAFLRLTYELLDRAAQRPAPTDIVVRPRVAA